MESRAAALVAGIIDRIAHRPLGTGRPPMPAVKVVAALRLLVREGVQWREAWMLANKRLDRRQDRLGRIILALLAAACIFIIANRLAVF